MKTDQTLLEAALIGYQHQRDLIEAKIAEIQRQIGGAGTTTATSSQPGKRTMNSAARERIAEAQRRRWAEYHKTRRGPAKKRQMSEAGRKRIAEATRKRWMEYRAAKAAASKGGKRGRKAAAVSSEQSA